MKLLTKKKLKAEEIVDEKLLKMAEKAETKEELSSLLDLLEKRGKCEKKTFVERYAQVIVGGLGLVGSLGGILLIMKHEQLEVFATKALNFTLRSRV